MDGENEAGEKAKVSPASRADGVETGKDNLLPGQLTFRICEAGHVLYLAPAIVELLSVPAAP
jgi:hypothetical protein